MICAQLQQWVHGTADLPLKKLLKQHGIHYEEERASRLDQLGMKVNEQQGIRIKSVLRGGAAELAGLNMLFIADTGRGKTQLISDIAWSHFGGDNNDFN